MFSPLVSSVSLSIRITSYSLLLSPLFPSQFVSLHILPTCLLCFPLNSYHFMFSPLVSSVSLSILITSCSLPSPLLNSCLLYFHQLRLLVRWKAPSLFCSPVGRKSRAYPLTGHNPNPNPTPDSDPWSSKAQAALYQSDAGILCYDIICYAMICHTMLQ